MQFIDIHPHIIARDVARYPPQPLRNTQSDWSKQRPQIFEQLIEQMAAAGVAQSRHRPGRGQMIFSGTAKRLYSALA